MAERRENTQKKKTDPIVVILSGLYLLFLASAILLIGRICYIQWIWEPDKELEGSFKPRTLRRTLQPNRGAIIASDGRLLAVSTPMYQLYMDCTVRKDVYLNDSKKGAAREAEWQEKARAFAQGFAALTGDHGTDYARMILSGREKGSKYMKLGPEISHETLQKVQDLPLISEGRYASGIIVERKDTRQYPYGTLARRTIGYVKNNDNSNGNNHIGLEGKFDYVLHGKEGVEYLRQTEDREWIQDFDSTYVSPENGQDVRTTLDINIQDIADEALRKQITETDEIEGGCVVVMDVATGAIRAMVNLLRDSTNGTLNETLNMVIGRKGEPGSVFKTTTLTTVIEDGFIHSLDDKIPSNHGYLAPWKGNDNHIIDYEREHGGAREIPIIEGFKVSSNYMFRYLAVTNYRNDPKKFLDHLYQYKLGQAFDFDLDGLATPTIPSPDSPYWSATDLGQVAMGYSVAVTPLHIITFYNALANDGKMMKPYLVEDIEKDGVVKKKLGPSVLNAAICSKATADTITRGLKAVIEEGTAKRLRSAAWEVAGKTGTSWVILTPQEQKGSTDPYSDKWGRKKNQATFVCFFPADEPRYTALVTLYSKLSGRTFYGGTLPALAMLDIVNGIHALDNSQAEPLSSKAQAPSMGREIEFEQAKAGKSSPVPDLKGLGLKDAIYAIENSGYRCSYSGSGHVSSQSPAPGKAAAPGSTVTITLQ